MSSESDDRVRNLIAEELTPAGDLLPPWVRIPKIPRYSLGWRMGFGEEYMWAWIVWAKDKQPEQLVEYFKMHLPLPFAWVDWVGRYLGLDFSVLTGEGNIEAAHRLEELGLIDFSEFKNWWENLPADFPLRLSAIGRTGSAPRQE